MGKNSGNEQDKNLKDQQLDHYDDILDKFSKIDIEVPGKLSEISATLDKIKEKKRFWERKTSIPQKEKPLQNSRPRGRVNAVRGRSGKVRGGRGGRGRGGGGRGGGGRGRDE